MHIRKKFISWKAEVSLLKDVQEMVDKIRNDNGYDSFLQSKMIFEREIKMVIRKGDWMQTYSGRKFYPMDPREEEIDIEDIAHALSMICRYGGHTKAFYSVAEHCVLVASRCPEGLELLGLLHDAAEAYIQDFISPIKKHFPVYKVMEENILRVIFEKYNLHPSLLDIGTVMQFDFDILKDEHEYCMTSGVKWGHEGKGINVLPKFWRPEDAEKEYLKLFNYYMEKT
jgi:uncharacterized protein